MRAFFIKALSDKPTIYAQIDEMYQADIDVYYQLAVSDPLYRDPMLTSGNLQQEEYARKLLGIFNAAQESQDAELSDELLGLFETAYPYAGAYAKSRSKIDIAEFGKALYKKNRHDMDVDEVLDYNAAMIFLCVVKGIPYTNADDILLDMHSLSQYYKRGRAIPAEKLPEVRKLSEKLPDDLLDSVVNGTDDGRGTEALYGFENLSQTALFRNLELSQREIELLAYFYLLDTANNTTKLPIKEYAYYHTHILLLCKAYKEVKDAYFRHNKETEYTELSIVNEKYREIKTKTDAMRNNAEKLMEWVNDLQRENHRLEQEIAQNKLNEQELYGLRNLMFTLENGGDEPAEPDVMPDWRSHSILVVGGLESWQKRIQEAIGCKCVNTDSMNFDLQLVDNAEILAFNIRHISHAIYERAINRATKQKIVYLNNDNINKNMAAIAECLR